MALKEYEKGLKEHFDSLNEGMNCINEIFDDPEQTISLGKFEVVEGGNCSIYYDRYLFYNNGLEYVLFDLQNKEELWTIMF